MSQTEDRLLTQWTTRRDPEAFRCLVDRHIGAVYATCLRILGHDTDAQDVVQECFEVLVEGPKTGPPRRLGPWLHGVATRKSLMRLRSEGRRKERETVYAAGLEQHAAIQWNDIYTYVDEAIEELPEDVRSPVVAHFLYGQTHGEIARATGVPRRTVTNRIQKGVELVGDFLRRRGILVPVGTLAALLSSELAHAAVVPASLMVSLGKLALSEAAAPGSVLPAGASFTAGSLVMKKALVGCVLAAALIGAAVLGVRLHGGSKASFPPAASDSGIVTSETPKTAPLTAASPASTSANAGGEEDRPEEGVAGTARFQDTGEPAAGVIVKAYNEQTDGEQTDGVTQAITDNNGKYRLTNLNAPERGVDLMIWADVPLKGWHAVIEDPGFRLYKGECREDVDILLVRGDSSISGVVLAKDTVWHPENVRSALPGLASGQERRTAQAWQSLCSEQTTPYAGVRVLLSRQGQTGEPISDAITDEDGCYSFSSLAPGEYVVLAVPPPDAAQIRDEKNRDGTKTVTVKSGESKEGIDLTLSTDDVTVTGRVTGPAGAPIAGASVTATPLHVVPPEGDDGFDRVLSKPVHAITDADGRYEIEGLVPASSEQTANYINATSNLPYCGSTYTICAETTGFAPAQLILPAIEYDLVQFTRKFVEERLRSPEPLSNDFNEEYPSLAASLPISPGNVMPHIDLVLQPEAQAAGRILDTQGTPLSEARIRMAFPKPQQERDKPQPFLCHTTPPDWMTSGKDGGFRFEAVPAGTYVFEVDTGAGPQRARNDPITLASGAVRTDLEVLVESAVERGNVEGRVVAANGAHVGEFSLQVKNVEGAEEASPRHGRVSIDKDAATYRIEGVSPGTVTLEIKAPGYARRELRVVVRPGETTQADVGITPEGVLCGHVMRNGQPSAYGYVTIPDVEHSTYSGTNEEGYYELRELEAGTYLVNFTMWLYEDERGGAQLSERMWIEVAAGRETRVDIDYDGSGVIHGAFRGPEETEWRVRVLDARLPEEERQRACTWKFKKNGRYEIPDLAPGTYTVIGECTMADDTSMEQSRTVSLPEEGSVQVDFQFP